MSRTYKSTKEPEDNKSSHRTHSCKPHHQNTSIESPHSRVLPPIVPVYVPPPQTSSCSERLSRLSAEHGIDVTSMEPIWIESYPDAKRHLFDPNTNLPRFALNLAIWKPLINAYFTWYTIPRAHCTRVWADIVDMLLRVPPGYAGNAEFKAWAYGCLCVFYLEDRYKAKLNGKDLCSSQYDPETNWSR